MILCFPIVQKFPPASLTTPYSPVVTLGMVRADNLQADVTKDGLFGHALLAAGQASAVVTLRPSR